MRRPFSYCIKWGRWGVGWGGCEDVESCKLTSSLIDTLCGVAWKASPGRIHFLESCLRDMRNSKLDLYRFEVSAALSRLSASLHCWLGCLTPATAGWYGWSPACCGAEIRQCHATPYWLQLSSSSSYHSLLSASLSTLTITCTCSKFNRSFFCFDSLLAAATFERIAQFCTTDTYADDLDEIRRDARGHNES